MDILVRLLAPKLSLSLGQTIIVENRPGASGNIGVKTNFTFDELTAQSRLTALTVYLT